jgi:hypothetical protein
VRQHQQVELQVVPNLRDRGVFENPRQRGQRRSRIERRRLVERGVSDRQVPRTSSADREGDADE